MENNSTHAREGIIDMKIMYSLKSALQGFILAICVLPTIGACQRAEKALDSSSRSLPIDFVDVAITGFNYTDRYIASFSVNGHGGGNLFVSGPNGGGGGTVCCVKYVAGLTEWTVAVRWQADACTYNNRVTSDGVRESEIYRYYKEIEVPVEITQGTRPKYLEVHFYPDGRLEVAMTEKSSMPRLNLESNRENTTPYRQCPNDKRPDQ